MEAPSCTTYMVCPIGDSEATAVVTDRPVHAATLRQRADVLGKAGINPLGNEYRKRANEATAKKHYHLFTEEEYALWCAYLDATPDLPVSEMTDGAVMRLKEALRHDCFDKFVMRQRRITGEVMIIGRVNTNRGVLYFPVTFWAPAGLSPVEVSELRTVLQEKRDREARAAAEAEARKLEQDEAYRAEQGKVKRLTCLTWSVAGLILALANLAFFGLLGWPWGLAPLALTLFATWWTWDELRHPLNRYDVRHFLIKPLAILCLVMLVGLGLAYAQFGSVTKTVTLCGSGTSSIYDDRIYTTAEGDEYKLTPEAVGQLYAEAGNASGYGKAKITITRHALFGDPVITSVDLMPSDSFDANTACERLVA